MTVVEQRYRAVLAVERGEPKHLVAAQFGVSRQTLHTWITRYRSDGLAGLITRSHRPASCPHQAADDIEVRVCELRRGNPRWGPRRIAHELAQVLGEQGPSRSTVARILRRNGLVEPRRRRKLRSDYRRWERPEPMALWQLDIVGGVPIDDGHGGTIEAKVVTGVDDHSRFAVIASVVARATGRAVCLAFADGRRVTIRIEDHVLLIFDPETRELLRTRPNPFTYDQARRLRGARPAGPPPRPSTEPVTIQRRASNTGTIMITRQLLALGRVHAHTVVTAHVAEHTITIDFADGGQRTFTRTTTGAIRNLKAQKTRTVS